MSQAVEAQEKTQARFRSVAVHTNLSLDRTEAAVSVVSEFEAERDLQVFVLAEITQAGLPVTDVEDSITLHPDGTILVQSATIKHVQLWWPNGMGRQPLYDLRLSLYDADDALLDRTEIRFGVRQLDVGVRPPASPGAFPLELQVNGRPASLFGLEWSGSTRGHKAETQKLLTLAAAAGTDFLRFRGAQRPDDEFYELCDRLGMLVWEDLIVGPAPAGPEGVVERIASARNHPSLAAWGSGLEGDEDPDLLEHLREIVLQEDPQRPWLAITPVESVLGLPPAPAGLESFGTLPGVAEAQAIQARVEAARRECPVPGFIAARHCDLLPGPPAPAYYGLKRALRPFHVTAAFATFDWTGRGEFRADVWLHNSGPERSLLNVVATAVDLDGCEHYQENLAAEAPESSAEVVGDLSWRFPADFGRLFLLLLEVIDEEGATVARNAYLHTRGETATPGVRRDARLAVERTPTGVRIRNSGPGVAFPVVVTAPVDALVGDSGFPILPGTVREIEISDPVVRVAVAADGAAPEEES